MLLEAPMSSAAGLLLEQQQLQTRFPKKAELESHSIEVKAHQLELFLKRFVDIVLSALGLLALSPLMLIIALVVRFTSPGPIIYKSVRTGKNKNKFYMYKFRTMIPNADRLRDELYEQANLQGQLFKLKTDFRVTPVGAFLRKYSLDEFPQLINVLKGEMSLVGPRPYIPEESEFFKPPYTARFSITPGVTGPWQVSGRSDLTFKQLCELELSYLQNWNLWQDCLLLLKTLPSVVLKKGAY